MPIWLGIQQKIISLLTKFEKILSYTIIPIKGCSNFIYCKAWRHESEYIKIIYLDATESLICSRALMIAQISAVNMDADTRQSNGNDGVGWKDNSASHRSLIPQSVFINRYIIKVPDSNFQS